MSLPISLFPVFFRAVHGHDPFPWQERLLHTVLDADWPAALSLPTASGKTAIMDVAVFALACQAGLPAASRRAPRRMALVVDRRIVVDDAFARATCICDALRSPQDPAVRAVAEALDALGGEAPLDVALLRGGIYREDRWARTPAQPVILCSTVDQVGSRLLHRGYGISTSMAPIHAGLLGNDCLIVLDEAHCSQPFLQTLAWIERFRAVAEAPIAPPFRVVAMTATPHGQRTPFTLDATDVTDPVLRQRLTAHKLAKPVLAGPKKDDFVTSCVEHVRAVAKPGTTTLVVVNRVATARAIRQQLEDLRNSKRTADHLAAEAILLTGRSRSLERDRLLEQHRHRLMAGRDRAGGPDAPPLIVVATQCVEVGADLDVDALVTECCSFDALRQRLGRLDRLGHLGEAQAVVICRPEAAGEKDKPVADPIYGEALSRTWHWLQDRKGDSETLDLGIAALDGTPSAPGILPADPAARAAMLALLSAPAVDAPIIFPAYCDLWVQTGPQPAVSPAPAIFLHGPQRGEPEVRLVWRADLGDDPATWADTISLCPPVSAESLPLPLHVARRWLARDAVDDVGGDVEGETAAAEARTRDEPTPSRLALRWRGPEHSDLARNPDDIRPGDLLVVPCHYGGCDVEGWNPDFVDSVSDLADAARVAARRHAVLRLHPSLVSADVWGDELDRLAGFAEVEWPEDIEKQIWGVVDAAAQPGGLPSAAREILLALGKAGTRKRHIAPHPSGTGFVLSSDLRTASERANFTDEDDTSARAAAVQLGVHSEDVARRAWEIATAAGLPPALVDDVVLAARLHDLGKADPRFQAWLAGGNRLWDRRQGLLTKSESLPAGAAALALARERAGYPQGGRHELLSVRFAESATVLLTQAYDRDLVLHLIASHHGHCRPFAPVVVDDRPLTVSVQIDGQTLTASSATGLERLDSGVAERFWGLVRRYGWWGLSYLDACLRLADHRASESPTTEEQP
jgi:CRISPR-associated endonuclease/helicase Cas3